MISKVQFLRNISAWTDKRQSHKTTMKGERNTLTCCNVCFRVDISYFHHSSFFILKTIRVTPNALTVAWLLALLMTLGGQHARLRLTVRTQSNVERSPTHATTKVSSIRYLYKRTL
jgi:hypothetical protein